jgi:AcrR family transcriptional regulator
MARDVNRPRRSYHSPLRTDQAQQTRNKILAAAYRLFAEHGYSGTTIAKVAESAGVAPETVYLSVGGKRRLLEGVIDAAIAGDDSQATEDDQYWAQVAALPDPSQRLEKMVEYSCRILARTRPIHAVIRGAADSEAFAAALGRRRLHGRLEAQTDRIRRFLIDDLRSGLSPAEAGERYCVLASPDLYYLLTVDLGWSAERHRTWLNALVQSDLIGIDPR